MLLGSRSQEVPGTMEAGFSAAVPPLHCLVPPDPGPPTGGIRGTVGNSSWIFPQFPWSRELSGTVWNHGPGIEQTYTASGFCQFGPLPTASRRVKARVA